MDPTWKHPFAAIVAGPSGSGKSYFVVNFIKNISKMCDTKFSNIFWHYSIWQPDLNIPGVTFIEGLPDTNFDSETPKLIIIDDLMRESANSSVIIDLFTKGCHHKNISTFFLTQNIFYKGKNQRDLSLNSHYLVLFKNPRDKAQIRHLAQQMCPQNSKFLVEAFSDATSKPHGYLLIDLKQSTPEEFRFRTDIFPKDSATVVYVPRK